MTSITPQAGNGHNTSKTIDVADKTLSFKSIPFHDETPTGAQLALAPGFRSNQSVIVLQLFDNGQVEEIRPEESANLSLGRRFVIDEADRTFRAKINGLTFDWLDRGIAGHQVRILGRIGADEELLLVKVDTPDQLIGEHDKVDLDGPGAEEFVSRKPAWKLNVQGVVNEYHVPVVKVRDALINAGIDPNAGWIIHLKVQGQPNRKVDLDFDVDLRTPGIEKIRLTAKDVNNGDAPKTSRRDFSLLPADVAYLNALGLLWEAVIEGDKRWLLIYNYPLPAGYVIQKATIALLIHKLYPASQIDMFYVFPEAKLGSGRAIPNTEGRVNISGQNFVQWSRHRQGTSTWNPNRDNVQTQMALADGALYKEIGE
jgi:hypothetical protein